MTTPVDYSDWQTPQAHADRIAATGAPLLAKSAVLANTTVSVPASGTVTIGAYTLAQISYEASITMAEATTGNGGAVSVALVWSDSVTGQETWSEKYWLVPGAPSSQHVVYGHGPARSDTLTVVCQSYNSAAVSVTLVLAQNSRSYPRIDWRTHTMGSATGYSVPNHDMPANILCSTSLTNAAGVSATRLLPMYTGRVTVHLTPGVNDWLYEVEVLDPTVTAAVDGAAWLVAASSHLVAVDVLLPGAQCALVMTNKGSSTDTGMAWITGESG